MKLRLRRIYYSLVILFFLTAVPVLLFYSAGFRYDLAQGKIYKIGALSVTTTPKRSTIYLDNKVVANKTPAVIKNLRPQEYELLIEKEGYFPWQQTVTIFGEQATILDNVVLVKDGDRELIDSGFIFQASQSPSRKYLAYIFTPASDNPGRQDLIKILDLEKGSTSSFPLLNSPIQELIWSPESRNILLNSDNSLYKSVVLNTETGRINQLNNPLINNCNSFAFHPENSDLLFCLNNNKIYQLNIQTKKVQGVLTQKAQSFLPIGDKIYFITSEDKPLLYTVLISSPSDAELITELPESTRYAVYNRNPHILTIADLANSRFYLLEKNRLGNQTLSELPFPGTNFSWSLEYTQFLGRNDFEVWIHDSQNNTSKLISRFGAPIKDALLNYENSLVIFSQEEGIKTIETDEQGGRHVNTILEDNAANLFIDPSGKTIFYITQETGVDKIYSYALHDKGILDL